VNSGNRDHKNEIKHKKINKIRHLSLNKLTIVLFHLRINNNNVTRKILCWKPDNNESKGLAALASTKKLAPSEMANRLLNSKVFVKNNRENIVKIFSNRS
jgi:hypothetical protein